jgi:adenylosuccinate synthase
MSGLSEAKDVIVTGLGFGDEAKGATVDRLCADRPNAIVVRYNGGAQAAHNVIAEGVHHTFSQFGSGTFAGARTFLDRDVLVEPFALENEANVLAGKGVSSPYYRLLTIHPDCLVTTLYHVAANRARENARGTERHGSCGRGIGETVWAVIAYRVGAAPGEMVENFESPGHAKDLLPLRVRDCLNKHTLVHKLRALREFYAPLAEIAATPEELAEEYVSIFRKFRIERGMYDLEDATHLIFEGAQGVLLDEVRGFHPYTTWSSPIPHRPLKLLRELGRHNPFVLGLTRSYHTRHGAGPFPSQAEEINFAEPHNKTGIYQGDWRQGWFDPILFRYATRCMPQLDGISISHLDYHAHLQVSHYHYQGHRIDDLPLQTSGYGQELLTKILTNADVTLTSDTRQMEKLKDIQGIPVALRAWGPDRKDRG